MNLLTFRPTSLWITNARISIASKEEKGDSFLLSDVNSFVHHSFYNI